MQHYTPESVPPMHRVGYLLVKARNLITAEMNKALKDLYVTGPQMSVLLAIQRGAASTPFELSKMLSVDTGLMTRMLDKLETKALLERSHSLEDRRVVNLVLTAKGKEIACALRDIAQEVLNPRLKKLTKAEFEELCRLLNKFIAE
jgi:DNA-binding MarR family transcriptional regulator